MIYKPIDMKSLKSCHPPYLCLAHEIQQPIPNLNFLTNQNKSENSGFVVPELVAGSGENDKKN